MNSEAELASVLGHEVGHVRYITAAGYDPFASADILSALEASTGLAQRAAGRTGGSLPIWVSTHPNSEARVKRAVQLAQAAGRPETSPAQDTVFLRMLDGLPYGAAADRKVVRVVTVGQGDTIDTLSARMAFPSLKRERFLTLNGLAPDQPLRPGSLVELVVAA